MSLIETGLKTKILSEMLVHLRELSLHKILTHRYPGESSLHREDDTCDTLGNIKML